MISTEIRIVNHVSFSKVTRLDRELHGFVIPDDARYKTSITYIIQRVTFEQTIPVLFNGSGTGIITAQPILGISYERIGIANTYVYHGESKDIALIVNIDIFNQEFKKPEIVRYILEQIINDLTRSFNVKEIYVHIFSSKWAGHPLFLLQSPPRNKNRKLHPGFRLLPI